MPTEASLVAAPASLHPWAARRILRLALGAALSLFCSQVFGWPLSFIAPVLTLFILSLPLPVPGIKQGLIFVLAMLAPMVLGLAMLPFLEHARWAGIVLTALALFYSFYYTARGGSAVMGTFMTLGLTLVVTVGSVNSSVLVILIKALAINAVVAVTFVWVAHALLPDPSHQPAAATTPPPAPRKPDPAEARRSALRSLLIVLPMVLAFLFMSASPAYTVVMIKVASLGQQASADDSRQMGRSLLTSTLWGGAGAIAAWQLLSAWPSLILYTLLIALAGLFYGRRIFHGAAVHHDFSTWSYAFLTMLVILAPAVLDTATSSGADAAFWSRLFLFLVIAIYGTAAVAVFDAFWPGPARSKDEPEQA